MSFEQVLNISILSSFYFSHELILTVLIILCLTVLGIFLGISIFSWEFGKTKTNLEIEILWTFFPLVFVIILGIPLLFYESDLGLSSSQWFIASQWFFTSSLGALSNFTCKEIFLINSNNLFFNLHSSDVIHAFYQPEQWSKIDMVPGCISLFYLKLPLSGLYTVYCAQICGMNHSLMKTFLLL